MKNDPIQAALARLEDLDLLTPEGKKQIGKALASRSNLVVAKAARIVGDRQCVEMASELAASFNRLLKSSAASDKGCAAMIAIARALVTLDHDDAELFRRGMKHVQMEGVWGGSEDVAAELRAVCAMGLANTVDPDRLRDLIPLLADPLADARSGAVRAITAIGSPSAALLLRLKALLGDADQDVLTECLTGLLECEGAEALPLVISFACGFEGHGLNQHGFTQHGLNQKASDQEVKEAAILALGASRRSDCIAWLEQRFSEVIDRETRTCILVSLASSRTEAALEFVLNLIRTGSKATAELALSAMSIHKADPRIRLQIDEAEKSRTAC